MKLALTIALTALLLAVTVLSAGCSCFVSSPQPYGPKVTGDGTGGAIAVYEDIRGNNQHDFYAQKISPEGDALWREKGVLVGSGYKYWDSFHDLHIVSDGSGGALVSWLAGASSEQRTYATYVVRLDAEGGTLWQREVRGVDQMLSDGGGGVIIATDYSLDEETLFIIKIDSEGNFPWGEDGVNVHREGYCYHTLGLVGDGSGGAIFIWQERKGEPGERVTQNFAQKIDAEGNLSWGDEATLLYTTPEGVYCEEPKAIGDGLGGTIAVWEQVPEGKIEDGSPQALLNDMYAQKIDANGNILWQPNGIPLEITRGGGECPSNTLVVSDGAGGAIVIWEDLRKGLMSLYAQKIDASGNILWQPGGEEVCYIKTNASFWPRVAVSDGSGGAIVTYSNRIQRIDADGRTIWPDDGILFTKGGAHAMDYDGYGGAIIAWGSGKSMFKSERSYVQRINAEGKLLWGEQGVRLHP
jgi:hypothetical protein